MFGRMGMAGFAMAFLVAGAAMAAEDGGLVLKRVVVSTGGVAYYEHEATVEGDAELTLDVRLDQVDDVLKSLVVFDAKGRVGAVRLPGREPLADVFRDLPFSAADLNSLAGLLQNLKGVEIVVAGPQTVKGRILSVVRETVVGEDKSETFRHRVGIAAGDGIHQFVLEEAKGLRFADPVLSKQIETALEATSKHRVADRRALAIKVFGDTRRSVRVGYVVAAPIWKTAYRLTVIDGSVSGLLQGWAVLENQSGHDWDGVALTLVSGNPVTFRQALYESYYVDRPEVPVDVAGHVLPSVDTGSREAAARAAKGRMYRDFQGGAKGEMMEQREMALEVPAPALMAPMGGGYAAQAQAANRAEATEAATQVLFTMPQPVTVPAGNSLVVPIVDRSVPAWRIDLFEPNTHKQHPLAAVRLVNDGDTSLPAGVLTVYERAGQDGAVAFVGDARVGMLPKGEERYASFALDAKTRVDQVGHEDQKIRQAKVSKGVLHIVSLVRETTEYHIDGPADSPVPVVIEHPRRDGWTLVEPEAKSVSETPSMYRITAAAGAGGKSRIDVVLERVLERTVGLADVAVDQFVLWSKDGDFPEAARNAFAEAARLRGALEELVRAAEDLRVEREAIVDDQERVRENLEAALNGSDLQNRYQKKLAAQEDRLEANDAELADLKARIATAREALATFIAGMDI